MTTGELGRWLGDVAGQVIKKFAEMLNPPDNSENNYNQLKQHTHNLREMLDTYAKKATSKAKNQVVSSEYTEWEKKASKIEQRLRSFCSKIDEKLSDPSIFKNKDRNTKIVQDDAKILMLIEKGSTIKVVIPNPLEKLVAYLNDPNVKRIGVYGIGNDKTSMVLTQLTVHKVHKKFDKVIRMDASNDVQSVQQDIAKQLNLEIQARGLSVQDDYAQKIHETLRSKKYLVIVNGVDSINLNSAGIMVDGNAKSKLVFSSKNRETCEEYKAKIVQV